MATSNDKETGTANLGCLFLIWLFLSFGLAGMLGDFFKLGVIGTLITFFVIFLPVIILLFLMQYSAEKKRVKGINARDTLAKEQKASSNKPITASDRTMSLDEAYYEYFNPEGGPITESNPIYNTI